MSSNASTASEIERAFATLAHSAKAGALLIGAEALVQPRAIAVDQRWRPAMRVPAIYSHARVRRGRRSDELRSQHYAMQYRQAGVYTGRILKGEKPADLPVHADRPSSSWSSISRPPRRSASTCRATLLARADEVIE